MTTKRTRGHWEILFFGVLLWLSATLANAITHPATPLKKEQNWLDQATQLVIAARGSHTDAILFNNDVRASRASLRHIMQKARHLKLSTEHRQLHSTMLVMDVLLKSAAACQTGGHIVCPPMLMSQLKTVLKNAYTKLDEVMATSSDARVVPQ